MRLVHYSDEPFGELREINYPPEDDWRTSFYKPHGLWVSDDAANYGWREWSIDNEFRLDRLTHVHDVTLVPGANIRVISTADELDRFNAEFSLPSYRDKKLAPDMQRFVATYGLLWRSVAERYDGLIITPYLWEKRLDFESMWYYAWDCASGCIWQRRAIQSVTLREVVPVPQKADVDADQ